MRVADFTFELPDSLIARHPLAERRGSRLLTLDGVSGALAHRQFTDLLEHLRPGDLMVFNNTRVIPARLFGQKASGGKLEILVERVLGPCAVGSLDPSRKPGDFVFCDQLVNFTNGRRDTFYDGPETTHISTADPYCPELRRIGQEAAQRIGVPFHERRITFPWATCSCVCRQDGSGRTTAWSHCAGPRC